MQSPCKDCEERHLGCHSHCEAYQAYHAENMRRIEENRRRRRLLEYQIDNNNRIEKMIRKKWRK